MKRISDGKAVVKKRSYQLTVDFTPWLDKLAYEQYVLVHAQDRPRDQEKWGILIVDGEEAYYCEASKIESVQAHEGWKLSDRESMSPLMATVYPGCTISEIKHGDTVEIISIEFEPMPDLA